MTARIDLILHARIDVERSGCALEFLVQHVGARRHGLRPQEFFVPTGIDFRTHDARHVLFEINHVHDQQVFVPDRYFEIPVYRPMLAHRIRGRSLNGDLQFIVCPVNCETVALDDVSIDLQLMPLQNNRCLGQHVDVVSRRRFETQISSRGNRDAVGLFGQGNPYMIRCMNPGQRSRPRPDDQQEHPNRREGGLGHRFRKK